MLIETAHRGLISLETNARVGYIPHSKFFCVNAYLKEEVFLSTNDWRTHNESGSKRVVVTKELPGDRWLEILAAADCRVEIGTSTEILSVERDQRQNWRCVR